MIHLCIDARMAYSSGIGTCIRQLVPLFCRSPFRITLLVDQLGRDWCQGIDQILFPYPIYSIREQLFFHRTIPSCDLFWSPHYNIPLLPTRAKKRIVTIHDACHLALGEFFSLPQRMYAKRVMKAALHKSDAVITDSLFSKAELIRYLGQPKKEIQVIYPGVDQDRFQPAKAKEQELVRQKYRLPNRFALFVGNFKPHKNVDRLIKAFEKVPEGLFLVIAGKGQGEKKTVSNVAYIGEIKEEDLVPLYTAAHLLVFPSLYEGFGLPPLEAMSCRLPVIVSNKASLPEVCAEGCLYVDPENISEISQAITKLDKDLVLRDELIGKGSERVERFSWTQSAKEYCDLFERISRS